MSKVATCRSVKRVKRSSQSDDHPEEMSNQLYFKRRTIAYQGIVKYSRQFQKLSTDKRFTWTFCGGVGRGEENEEETKYTKLDLYGAGPMEQGIKKYANLKSKPSEAHPEDASVQPLAQEFNEASVQPSAQEFNEAEILTCKYRNISLVFIAD